MKLEPGTVEALHNNQTNNPLYKNPVLQITLLGKLSMAIGDKQRYKVNLSDGVKYMRGIFSSEITSYFDRGLISKFSLIRPGKFSVRSKDGTVYIYIQEVLEYEDCNVEIGRPVNVSTGNASFNENNEQAQATKGNPGQKSPDEDRKRIKKDDGVYTMVNMLNPFHNKWTIRGRVVTKSDIRRFSNQKGEGKVFNFELSDGTAQIKITCFSECVDIFYPLIEIGKVYTVTKGSVKMANKQYSTNAFDYEIVLDKNSEVHHVADDEAPRYFFNFTNISDIAPGNMHYDVVGVVRELYPASTVVVRSTQAELLKRDIVLADESGSIRLTLWGAKAEIDVENDSVLALKSVKASDYNGVSISTTGSSQIIVNPDIPESHKLVGWYQSIGRNMPLTLPRKEEKKRLIQEVKDNELTYSTIQGTVMFLKEDALWYASCQGEGCNKKVIMEDNGSYRCERCNKVYGDCDYRYMVSLHLGDFTGQLWATLFDEVATSFFGLSAKEMKIMSDESPDELQSLIKGMYFKEYFFKLKAKQDNYNDEVRTRYTGLSVEHLDISKESRKLLDIIEKAIS